MSDAELTLRQRLVPDIGDEGMARLAAARATIAGAGDAAVIEARYLACAGFGVLVIADETARASALAADPRQVVEAEVTAAAMGASDAPWVTTLAAQFAEDDPAVKDLVLGAARAIEHLRAGIAPKP